MSFKCESITIDSIDFKVVQFPATEAYKLKRRLARVFAPFVTSVLAGAESGKDLLDAKLDPKALASGVEKVLEELPEDEFLGLIKRLLSSTTCILNIDDKPVQIDFSRFEESLNLVFTGRTFSIYPLLWFVLKVNYPDFFSRVKGIGSLRSILS